MAASTSIEAGEEVGRRRRIEEKRTRLEALRPLAGRSLKALAHWYDVELTWSSNAIEGNTLSRSETAIILEKGLTIGGKPLKDHLEISRYHPSRRQALPST
jgi:Fic family protein